MCPGTQVLRPASGEAGEQVRLLRHPGLKIAALAAAGATVLAACGGGSNNNNNTSGGNTSLAGGFGKVPAQSGTPHPGTVSFAEPPSATPTWILPIITAAANSVYTVLSFDYQMWRPLYWQVNGVSAAIDPAESLANPPKWSNNDKTVTVTMKNWKWSDGQPISSKDVLFDIDLIKAAIKESPANWVYYTPGFVPDDIASMSTPNSTTLVLNLKSTVNPGWFYDDELAVLQPMPAHAWAKASASGPVLDFTNPANAKKIYDFLAKQSKAQTTWAASPIWHVVDGPFQLTSFNNTTGADTMKANPAYSGPSSHQIKTLDAVPFTSDTAEFNAVKAGSIDQGYIPSDDVPQVPQVKAAGYNVFGYPTYGWTYITYNFKDKTGDWNNIVHQLYIRQALAHLEDQQGYITAFMHGAGGQAFGPVPSIPANQYTPADAKKNPYPFSVSAAKNLLSGHGWKVVPNGTDTCVKPGTGAGQCGAGIPAGTKLAFNLIYSTNPALIGQQVTDLSSKAKQVGINITLQSSNFNYMVTNYNDPAAPGNANKWAMEDFGGFTNSVYPTTFSVFNTPGGNNLGGYSDPTADKLITASISGTNPSAVRDEASYLTMQQPGLFQPNPDQVEVWKKTLSGPPASFANLTQFYVTPELWYFTK
jgi:peptide/nickel transport system substrate-binding protein